MTSVEKYSRFRRTLHWSMFVLVALAYATMEFRGWFPRGGALRSGVMQGHYWFGLAVLALLLPRMLAAHRHPLPPLPSPPWQHAVLRATHLALYAFLLLQPLLGLFLAGADGKHVYVPGTEWALPLPMAADEAWEERLGEWHETLANIFYVVIGLHIAAALWHHFVLRDATLKRMA